MRLTKRCLLFLGVFLTLIISLPSAESQGKADNSPDWFYPGWAADAKNNKPIIVRDTESALGRYSSMTKEIGLKDLARIHGHLCDGLVIAFLEIKAALEKLFPEGVVDRTDLRAVSKNAPCWIDAVAMMTGARINFQTLRIDNSVGDGFIIQRISTNEAYEVHLRQGIFPEEQAVLENKIRKLRSEGKPVAADDIDAVEKMADHLSQKLLNAKSVEILDIKPLPQYQFRANDLFSERGDIINKTMPRRKP